MQSHDAEFAPRQLMSGENKTPDEIRVDRIMELLRIREDWRTQLYQRARTVERDIEAWFSAAVQRVADNPKAEVLMKPPSSMFDVEPPF